MNKAISLVISMFLILSNLSAQKYDILRDTSVYNNYNKKVNVVHTYITHYYYLDTVCIQLLCYPQLSGLSSRIVENDLNKKFSSLFSFGMCDNDKECELPPIKFGSARASYQFAKVHFI